MSAIRVHLLRAVNVGGAKMPMAHLRDVAVGLGATQVSTYIASGNLLAVIPGDASKPEDCAAFDRALERACEERFGFFREVISRNCAELAHAIADHPFEVEQSSYSYVLFLSEAPKPEAIAAAAAEVPTGDDRWQVIGRDLHVRYARGAGRAELSDKRLYRLLGVTGTGRNLNTVRRLCELME